MKKINTLQKISIISLSLVILFFFYTLMTRPASYKQETVTIQHAGGSSSGPGPFGTTPHHNNDDY